MTSRPHQAGIKRALSHLGGPVDTEGEAGPAKSLAHALDVSSAEGPERHKLSDEAEETSKDEEIDRAHVHGFHAYPARMHPTTAARLVTAFAPEGGVVLDPFCGSGTVLVESLIAGRDALGTDLNPLAVRLARAKTAPRDEDARKTLISAASRVRAIADERRKTRAGATKRYDQEDAAMFDPHVLLELDSLRAGSFAETDPNLRADLLLVLSAILVKVSRRRSDTATRTEQKRIAAGYTAKLFLRKAEELARRSAAFEALLPSPRPRARVRDDDATKLSTLKAACADVIVTSPPYAATYDYLTHHAMRLRWLGLDSKALEDRELGPRRRYNAMSGPEAETAWVDELSHFFAAAARVVRPKGAVVVLIADSESNGHALRGEVLAAVAAHSAGLRPLARASQQRPHFHDQRAFATAPRREHALYFQRR